MDIKVAIRKQYKKEVSSNGAYSPVFIIMSLCTYCGVGGVSTGLGVGATLAVGSVVGFS